MTAAQQKLNDKILAALDNLDHGNDEHWTTDGQPKVDVVQGLAGLDKLTRKQISQAAPEFAREQVEEDKETEKEVDNEGADKGDADSENDDAASSKDGGEASGGKQATVEDERDDAADAAEADLAKANDKLNRAMSELQAAQENVKKCQNQVHHLQNRLSRLTTVHHDMNAVNIQRYLATQRELNRQRAEQIQAENLATQPAPIDAARSRQIRQTARPLIRQNKDR